MSPTGPVFPSIEQVTREHAEHGGQVLVILSNLSFPSRYYTQVPWSGPSTPLVVAKRENLRRFKKINFARTTHSSRRVAFSSSHDGFHVAFEADFWRRVKDLFTHTKLKLRESVVRMRERIARNAHLSPRPAGTNATASPSSSASYLPTF